MIPDAAELLPRALVETRGDRARVVREATRARDGYRREKRALDLVTSSLDDGRVWNRFHLGPTFLHLTLALLRVRQPTSAGSSGRAKSSASCGGGGGAAGLGMTRSRRQ